MLRQIRDMPLGTHGFEAVGEVDDDDWERTVEPVLRQEIAEGRALRLLYLLGPATLDVDDDVLKAGAGFRARHVTSFERVAVVSDEDWIRPALRALSFLLPGEAKGFRVHRARRGEGVARRRADTVTSTDAPESSPPDAPAKQLTVRGAAVLGIGSMIGAGIFALLGEAGAVAGAAVWMSFLIAGIVAVLIGYVCVKLGVRYPTSGGLITYLIAGFGRGRLTGITAWLGYISAVVIVTAMVAVSFGGYATSLFIGENADPAWNNVFITAVILIMVGVNLVGAQFVARAQTVIVAGVLAVFSVFIVVTIADLNPDLLAFSGYPSFSKIISSVALTFFAYLGFNVITFAVGDLRDPARNLPRAMYSALGITAVVYVLISLGVFGTLTTAQVVDYGETAIAEAARPALGDAGFTVMAIAALLSTAASTNATLYASSNLTESLADEGLFPADRSAPSPAWAATRAC